MININVDKLIEQIEWAVIPDKIITREGLSLATIGEIWHLPYSMCSNAEIDLFRNYIISTPCYKLLPLN